jgi:hypothetical protein
MAKEKVKVTERMPYPEGYFDPPEKVDPDVEIISHLFKVRTHNPEQDKAHSTRRSFRRTLKSKVRG